MLAFYTDPSPTQWRGQTTWHTSYTRTYTTWRPTVTCNVPLIGKEGSFDTPAFKPTNQPCSRDKRWMITVPSGHYVEMIIESIDLGPRACFLDTYITVRDGHSLSSNVLGHYCEGGSNPRNITSSSNKMLVEIIRSWRSLSSGFVTQDSPGFKARYVARKLSDGGWYNFVVPSNGMNRIYFRCFVSLTCQQPNLYFNATSTNGHLSRLRFFSFWKCFPHLKSSMECGV